MARILSLLFAFQVREVPGKGRGVFATRAFAREEFVCEYAGELVDRKTAQEREAFYGGKADVGCYMYYFNFNGMKYWYARRYPRYSSGA